MEAVPVAPDPIVRLTHEIDRVDWLGISPFSLSPAGISDGKTRGSWGRKWWAEAARKTRVKPPANY